MRSINIRQLQQHFHAELKNIPFIVTRHGKPIFTVNLPEAGSIETQLKDRIPSMPRKTAINKQKVITKQLHKNPFSLCKKHKIYYSSCGCKQ